MKEITKEDILNDVKENNIALKYALKYVPDIVTDDLLKDIVRVSKFAIRYVPKDRITEEMIKDVVRFKDPRCLHFIPRDLLTDDIDKMIVTTFTMYGLKHYFIHFKERLTEENVKIAMLNCPKKHREYLKQYLPFSFRTDEILNIVTNG